MAVVAHVYVASANYPARARGVRGGSSVADAMRACPELVLIEVDRGEAEEVGDALFELFREVGFAVEPASAEEAFIDPGSVSWEDAVAIGQGLRARVKESLGITVSVGIGRTKLMAKLASRGAKPDGLRVIRGEEELSLRTDLPLSDVWGVGGKTLERLRLIGVTKLIDLDAFDRDTLRRVCGMGMARKLVAIREGVDDSMVRAQEHRSEMSAEGAVSGYARPDKTVAELLDTCVRRACARAGRVGLAASGLTIQVKTRSDHGRAVTVKQSGLPHTNDADVWLKVASELAPAGVESPIGVKVTLTRLTRSEHVVPPLF